MIAVTSDPDVQPEAMARPGEGPRNYEGTKIVDLENQCLRDMVTALPGAILASATFATLALQRLRTRFRFAGLCVSVVPTLTPSPFAKCQKKRSAMRHWLRRCAAIAAFGLVLASLPLTELASPAISRADDGCGDGMYYNYQTLSCEPWVQVGVYVDPYIPVPIPNWNPIDVDLNPDIDLNPGGPGGISPGRPGGGGRGGGGRR